MTFKQVADMIDAMGYPFAYYQFEPDPDNPPPDPPFICFYYPASDDLMADNSNYARITQLIIELYTDNKDFAAESAVEFVLGQNGLPWSKTEQYIDSEHMYQITYNTEVVINA